jgi:hypothetical protein
MLVVGVKQTIKNDMVKSVTPKSHHLQWSKFETTFILTSHFAGVSKITKN